MPVLKLTEELLPTLKCPENRTHAEYYDQFLKGFYVDVMQNGRMSYRVRYTLNNKKHIYTIGNPLLITTKEAREEARKILRKAMRGLDPKIQEIEEDGITLEQFFSKQYMPYVKSYKRSWATDEGILRNHILPALGDRPMGNLSPPEIATFVEKLKQDSYASATINRILVLLRYGYSLALTWNVEGVSRNPLKDIKNLRVDNKIERYLTEEQKAKLLVATKNSQNPKLADIVAFLLFTGARKREVLDAKWEDVDFENKFWRIPKTKSGKVRHIPLSKGAMALLSKLRDMKKEGEEYIFTNDKTGKPYVSIFYSWDTARKEADLPDLRIHDLRHSFASFLVNAGRSLYEVKELLGHADIQTTTRYAHLSKERLREAVEKVPV